MLVYYLMLGITILSVLPWPATMHVEWQKGTQNNFTHSTIILLDVITCLTSKKVIPDHFQPDISSL